MWEWAHTCCVHVHMEVDTFAHTLMHMCETGLCLRVLMWEYVFVMHIVRYTNSIKIIPNSAKIRDK